MTFPIRLGVLIFGVLIGGAAVARAVEPVETESGLVSGVEEGAARVFKGLPFAAPPVGDLRWRAPQPVPVWPGVKAAESFSPACPQNGSYPPEAPKEQLDEDCLYLNVWTPRTPAPGKLPVMVWIYGGGLENGSGAIPLYSGARLVEHNVILVTLNYRLGVLGFLALPALSREAAYGSSGNYGLLDQIAALQWVHRNIAAFGGDPGNVTIFGQSSGAMSVSALTTSPLTAGLFHRAIGQSGGLFEPIETSAEFSLSGAEKAGKDYVRRTGGGTLADLRRKRPGELSMRFGAAHFIVDGYALVKSPYQSYRDGEQHDVPLLIGSNADEGELFLGRKSVTAANFAQSLAEDFPPLLVALMGAAPGANDAAARKAAAAFETDMRFHWDMWTWARLAAATSRNDVFFYQFSQVPPFGPGDRYFGMGATHGMEMPYVFDNLDKRSVSWTPQDHALADAMSTYWTNFAASGDPNGTALAPWPRFDAAKPQAMMLGEALGPGPIPREAQLRRMDRVYGAARVVAQNIHLSMAAAFALAAALIAGLVLMIRARFRR